MVGTTLILRIRTKNGMLRIQTLTSNNTLNDLKKAISEQTGMQLATIKILKGYPPKAIESGSDNSTLTSLYIRDGDLLTVEESEIAHEIHQQSKDDSNKNNTKHKSDESNKNGVLLRKVVPADNSCLFTSIYYVINNGLYDLNCQKSMREIIANTVKSDINTFNEVFLGKKNKEYCEWIKNTSTWGGAIEIAILSKYYKVEICVVDIQSVRIDRFGEDCNYTTRVFILYDGIHYDPLHLELNSNDSKVQTRFSVEDDLVLEQAYEISKELKNSRQYTDLANFTLRCLVCQTPLTGQIHAQEHAKKTGHINFGEV